MRKNLTKSYNIPPLVKGFLWLIALFFTLPAGRCRSCDNSLDSCLRRNDTKGAGMTKESVIDDTFVKRTRHRRVLGKHCVLFNLRENGNTRIGRKRELAHEGKRDVCLGCVSIQ